MLGCECGIMKKNSHNPLALSSKKPCWGHMDNGPERKNLCAGLEAERNQNKSAHRYLCLKLKRLREEAEWEQHKAVRELTARRGSQKHRHSNRPCCLPAKEGNIKDCGRISESTGREALGLCSRKRYIVLEQLLLTLSGGISGEHGVSKLYHRQELELEKAILLCHLLQGHRAPLQEKQHTGHLSKVSERLSRKTAVKSSNLWQTVAELTHSGALVRRPQSASYSSTKKSTLHLSSVREVGAADSCTTAADACQSSSLKIHNTPHAQWRDQPPYCTESLGSDESPPSKWMGSNMEVRNKRM